MAELARNYHDRLQQQNINDQNEEEHTTDIECALRVILALQKLVNPEQSLMSQKAITTHV